jgi:hypothetical protein
MSGRIEDYGLIGDFETAALVSKGGSISAGRASTPMHVLPPFSGPAAMDAGGSRRHKRSRALRAATDLIR